MNSITRILPLLILMSAAHAQPGRVDIRGDIGWTGFLDEGPDNHALYGASASFYVTRKLAIQPEFQYLTRTRNFGGRRHYDTVLLANVAWDMRNPGARVVPYLIVGPGFLWTHEFGTYRGGYATGGGGVKIFVTPRWYVAPDFRIGWEPHARFSVGVGYVVKH